MTIRKYKPATKPLTIFYYGNGKGKTTAALGTALRAAGHGNKVLILQAIKGSWPSGERKAVPKYLKKLITIRTVGKGFVGILDDELNLKEHKKAAAGALILASNAIKSQKYDLIVLDEYGDLPPLKLAKTSDLISITPKNRKKTNVIITGHKAPKPLINHADLVTEFKNVKHPFDCGIIAKKGIDF